MVPLDLIVAWPEADAHRQPVVKVPRGTETGDG